MQCCMRNEVSPSDSSVQTPPSNHLQPLPFRTVVVSVKEQAAVKTWGATLKCKPSRVALQTCLSKTRSGLHP